MSDIKGYFEYIIKKHEIVTDNPSIMIYVNKIENRIMFKIKTRSYLELLTPETMKLLGSTKSKITKDKNGENWPHLETTELILVHSDIADNDYQQYSRVLYRFVSNKSFGQLLDISPKNIIFLKIFNSELSYIEVWFTDQNPKPLEIEDKNMDKNISKNVSGKYSQKILDHAKQPATDALKSSSKKVIQKTADRTSDLIGNKIANKIAKVFKNSQENNSKTVTNEHDKERPKKKYVCPENIQEIIDELSLK